MKGWTSSLVLHILSCPPTPPQLCVLPKGPDRSFQQYKSYCGAPCLKLCSLPHDAQDKTQTPFHSLLALQGLAPHPAPLSSLTPLAYWPLFHSSNPSASFLPLGLCTCCSFHLGLSAPTISQSSFRLLCRRFFSGRLSQALSVSPEAPDGLFYDQLHNFYAHRPPSNHTGSSLRAGPLSDLGAQCLGSFWAS